MAHSRRGFARISNLAVCCAIFLLGLMADYLLGLPASQGNIFAMILYPVVPNWQYFWMADALAAQKVIPTAYILWSFCYLLLIMAVFTICAVILFQDREVGNTSIAA